MLNIVFYFQVHQPYRLKRLNIFDVGNIDDPFDDDLNRVIINKVSEKCYIPTNKLLLKLIDRYEGRFKVAFSMSGTAIEQFRHYNPAVMDLFAILAKTGCVEFISETYYHSLSSLFSREEFIEQVTMHLTLMQNEFGVTPVVFRNTELIYENRISDYIRPFKNFHVILTEGADKILGWRSPLYPYRTYNDQHYLMLKYYSLADDIAFRFSDRGWVEFPLTGNKFVHWVDKLHLIEKTDKNLYLNLFMDYETFGEHQWEDTGIFHFFESLPDLVFKEDNLGFAWPSDVVDGCDYPTEKLSINSPISWADTERDLSAWLSNDIQKTAAESIYTLLNKAKNKGDDRLVETVRRLTTSDIVYYMSTKYFQDGDVHKYFSPYPSPENAYLYFLYAMADIEEKFRI